MTSWVRFFVGLNENQGNFVNFLTKNEDYQIKLWVQLLFRSQESLAYQQVGGAHCLTLWYHPHTQICKLPLQRWY